MYVCHHRLSKSWYPPNPNPLPTISHSSPLILPLTAQTSTSVTSAMVVARTCALTQLAPTIVPVPMATGWRRTCTPVSVSAAAEWPCRKGWPTDWSHHPPHGWNKED